MKEVQKIKKERGRYWYQDGAFPWTATSKTAILEQSDNCFGELVFSYFIQNNVFNKQMGPNQTYKLLHSKGNDITKQKDNLQNERKYLQTMHWNINITRA